jgi:hypothetical protein
MSADGSLLFVKTLHRTFLWHRRVGESVVSMLSARPAGDCIYAADTAAQDGIIPQGARSRYGRGDRAHRGRHAVGHHRRGPKRPLMIWRFS